jgi:quercetin dioxygenase-like cupin family protein
MPVPREGCVGVESRVLFVDEEIGVAMLRFAPHGTIDEHAAPHDIDVVCLEGAGYTSVEDRRFMFKAGEIVRWPRERRHRLWTDGSTMTTLMLERLRSAAA